MKNSKKTGFLFIALGIMLCVSAFLNICYGAINIPLSETITILFGTAESNTNAYIIWQYRLPKALTAVLVGSGLSLSGLLMQTLFRNPLAGPFVLGISSGASLGVAVLIMGSALFSGFFTFDIVTNVGLSIAASLGSFLVLWCVVLVASYVKDTMALLIIGLMFGSITGAVVGILSYFTDSEKLRQFIFWSFGSVGHLTWHQLLLLAVCVLTGVVISCYLIKSLNGYLLNENYAKSIGVQLKKSRYLIILTTGILAGSITAFAGPIAFVGLAVPHICRQLFSTMDHKVLIPAVILLGAIVLLVCDIAAQLPGTVSVLPINAVTCILGAPVVIWLLLKDRKMFF